MSVRKTLVDWLETYSRFAYSWITDNDEILGEIIYTLHLFGFYTLVVLLVVSHTVYPVFWFQALVFGFVVLVWIQHVVLNTCVVTCLERRLLGKDHPLTIDIVLNMFGIPVQKETRMGITVLLSTTMVLFLGLELVARGCMYGRSCIGLSTWI